MASFKVGVLAFFPTEQNLRLWRLMVRRTREYYDEGYPIS
jgi:hypothetical protein